MSSDGWMHAYHSPGWDDEQATTAESELSGVRATSDGPCGYGGCDEPILKDQRVVAVSGHRPVKKPARKRAAKKTAPANPPSSASGDTLATAEAPGRAEPDPDGREGAGADYTIASVKWTVAGPGLMQDMPERVYHADPWDGSVSNSDAMLLLDSPAVYRWRRDHPGGGSRSMNLGSAAHTRVLGAGAKLVKIEDHEYRKNETKAARNAAYAAGQIPLLGHRKPLSPGTPCEWEVVDEMAAVLERDPLAPHLFADGRPEVSAFWLCPTTGVKRRARFDFLPNPVPGAPMLVFPDYKSTAKSVSPASFAHSADDFGYDMQAANYEEAIVQLGLAPAARMVFVLQSTEAPYLVAVHQLTEKARERGRARTLRALRRYQHCMATGYWFGWEGVVHQVDLPAYAYTRDENDARREPVYDEAR